MHNRVTTAPKSSFLRACSEFHNHKNSTSRMVHTISLLLIFASSFHHVFSQLCLPGPSGITHFNHLCNETFSDANGVSTARLCALQSTMLIII